MARNHARIFTSIWNDDDFLALSAGEQRMYLMLLSQPNLSHCGLIPLTVRRWAKKAPNSTVEQVGGWLDGLRVAGFIAIDDGTEELLVRSLMRGDRVYEQPNVMKAAISDVGGISSRLLLSVVAGEVRRMLTLEGLSDTVRALLETLVEGLPEPFAEPFPKPPGEGENHLGEQVDSPTPTPATSLAPAEPPRELARRDDVWDALMDACDVEQPITTSARGAYNRAAKDLRSARATPDEISRRAAVFRHRWPEASLTPTALARRWAECARAPNTVSRGDRQVAGTLALAQRLEEADQ